MTGAGSGLGHPGRTHPPPPRHDSAEQTIRDLLPDPLTAQELIGRALRRVAGT